MSPRAQRPWTIQIGLEEFTLVLEGRDAYGVYSEYDGKLTTVTKEGSRWVALAYPGKKWASAEQAVTYAMNMKRSE